MKDHNADIFPQHFMLIFTKGGNNSDQDCMVLDLFFNQKFVMVILYKT